MASFIPVGGTMQIIADSASLYSKEEGKKIGVTIIPACAVINGEIYRDYEDISNEEFLKLIAAGGIPTSSQPAIGDIMEVFEKCQEEILFLPVGDGLSGTYQNAMGAKNSMEKNDHIHILDTKTLAGPQRYLIKKALKLRDEGVDMEKIKAELQKCIESSVSFVIPTDFNFLKRSGRLTPIAAKIGSLIKIVPVLTQTEDKRRITPFAIKRSRKKAVDAIMTHLKSMGVDKDYIISISHAGVYENAKEVFNQIKEQFASSTMELFHLSPALITHGGPGCIVIQAVKK